ncbi:MAG: hypothetical protein JST54_30285 [Deltaproteobacteria bacterium]|nr:hypothetical protein [Deltaproteobacteria bacterium]
MIRALVLLATLAGADLKTVGSSKEAAAAIGQDVRVSGIAQDSKLSGVVVTGELVVYCLDHPSWSARAGKRITVEGKLEQTRELEAHVDDAGAISQGTGGPIFVIRACTVK